MRLTEEMLKKMIAKMINKSEVPQEAKEKIFADMVKNNLVPKDGTIEDADFWEVKPGDYGYESAVEINGKRYYGEI
tara:strand:+ start:3803 stop:4030 length:228 start_codon:yes stop_codon:yes gene_type:complete